MKRSPGGIVVAANQIDLYTTGGSRVIPVQVPRSQAEVPSCHTEFNQVLADL